MDLTEIERADRMQMNEKLDLSGCGLEVLKLSLIGIINSDVLLTFKIETKLQKFSLFRATI